MWLLAPAVWWLLDRDWNARLRGRRSAAALFMLGVLWCAASALYWKSWKFAFDHPALEFRMRALPNAARLYRRLGLTDDVEVLAENIAARELGSRWDLDGVYIWNLGFNRALWIIPRRAWRRGGGLRWCPSLRSEVACHSEAQVFEREGECLKLRNSSEIPFERHSFFGEYVMIWTDSEVLRGELFTAWPVYLR